jgi:hypothetical protein
MRAMRLTLLSMLVAAPLVATGCAPLYEEVPAFGETDPNQVAAVERRPQPQQQYAIQSQEAVDPGQPVIAADGEQEQQQDQDYTDTDPSALTEFKSTLDPYGTWQDDGQYGTVWQPDPGVVGSDFAPYVTAGHWNYDSDYTWVSDYDWGWAPFHYGRWVFINGRGWCWIPGRRYAGAWVSWRVGPAGYGYVGWGPMAPSYYWRGGRAYGVGWNVNTPYTFCHTGELFSPTLHGRTIGGGEVVVIGNNTRPYTDGRTPAHPTVGPPLSHLGVTPPAIERSPGILRARALAHPGNVSPNAPPSQVPYAHPYAVQPRTFGGGYNNPPVVTAPRYNGVVPQPYHAAPIYRPSQVEPRFSGQPNFNQPHYGGPSYGPGYNRFGGGPSYGAPHYNVAQPPVYHGGGNFGGSSGGGWHPPSSSFSSSSSSHSYTHSHGGGGHGHR